MTSPQPSLQFQAPPSADSSDFAPIEPLSASQARPFSIDLSLELERQLDMESLPPTPAHNASMQTQQSAPVISQLRDSLDPDVLAHIISQLRRSLTDMTKERDDLVNLLSSAHSREAELQDALQHMTDKATNMEDDLMEARRKNKDDEEAISLLRTKVEESRRGLMRLQTENRRQSVIAPLDLSRANLSPPSKRASSSFTPLTGSFNGRPNGHRRISSVSDSGLQGLGFSSDSTHAQVLTMPGENPNPNPSPMASKRMSGFFGTRLSPGPPQEDATGVSSAELQALRKEIASLKSDLEDTRHELSEAVEGREASETCVTALRAFIQENNIGSGQNGFDTASIKLPPPPASTTGNEADTPASKAGWGFKLWSAKPAANGPTPAPSSVDSPSIPAASVTGTPTQISKKLGGFFSRQSSISSVSIPVPTNLDDAHRASMYSYESRSETSSIEEPLSPISDHDDNVMVREVSSGSSRPSKDDLVTVDLGEQKVAA
ncbi:hypothetical protein BT96DRAFT_829245 [Gymnopus androsaceus JB14]|uniref:Uncharacterized protein n=1 Tax=Gymnopus androsaceus JB14 TaxID=1447944 RepID=A0A6A4H5K2_9AGAR|nr:hypothetical protein BT96DRAFT_829245 [Gymnopus androsaceus JB14]